jgi:hypothetical protein
MSHTELSMLTENLIRSAIFGLSVLVVVTFFSGAILIRINIKFSNYCQSKTIHSSLPLRMHFVYAVFKLCLVQIVAMLMWTTAVYAAGLTENLRLAFMFVGSCFTTLGIVSDIFPVEWQSVAFYIAFSGLFSFAFATSVMITLVTDVVKALPKHTHDQTSGV